MCCECANSCDCVFNHRRSDPAWPPRPSHDAEGGCCQVWTGPHQGTAGGAAGHTEEDLHKMDELFSAKGMELYACIPDSVQWMKWTCNAVGTYRGIILSGDCRLSLTVDFGCYIFDVRLTFVLDVTFVSETKGNITLNVNCSNGRRLTAVRNSNGRYAACPYAERSTWSRERAVLWSNVAA